MSKNQVFTPEYEAEVLDLGALSEAIDYGLKIIGAPEAWKVTQGAGVRVGVLDTGWPDHPDVILNVSGREPSDGLDHDGHGTHVAGIIAACQNDDGVVGVAPKAVLYCAKAVPGSWKDMIRGLEFCERKGCEVINMSLGGYGKPGQDVLDTVARLHKKGIVLIASAGNVPDHGITYPARLDHVIPVAAVGPDATEAPFAVKGSELEKGFCMPGVNVYSTWLNGQYAKLSGTSMAAPHLTGVVALMLSKHWKQKRGTAKTEIYWKPCPDDPAKVIRTTGPEKVQSVIDHLIGCAKNLGDPTKFGYGYIDATLL